MNLSAIPERDQQEHHEDDNLDEELLDSAGNRCLSFLCFPFGFRRRVNMASRRSLLTHGDHPGTREKWWDKRSKSAKDFVLQSMDSFRLKSLVQRFGCGNDGAIKRRKPIFRYDSKSYAMNFDERDDRREVGEGEEELLQCSQWINDRK